MYNTTILHCYLWSKSHILQKSNFVAQIIAKQLTGKIKKKKERKTGHWWTGLKCCTQCGPAHYPLAFLLPRASACARSNPSRFTVAAEPPRRPRVATA